MAEGMAPGTLSPFAGDATGRRIVVVEMADSGLSTDAWLEFCALITDETHRFFREKDKGAWGTLPPVWVIINECEFNG